VNPFFSHETPGRRTCAPESGVFGKLFPKVSHESTPNNTFLEARAQNGGFICFDTMGMSMSPF
jgi:hypothetical protein